MSATHSSSQERFALGQHLVVERSCFSHHGIYVGYGQVIENLLEQGIVAVPLQTFADGAPIKVRNHPFPKYSAHEAVRRAYSRIGEKSYDLLTNNCEHFVNWCIEGICTSRQVDNCITLCKPLVDFAENLPILGEKLKKAKEQSIQGHLATNPHDYETSAHFNHETQFRQTVEDMFGGDEISILGQRFNQSREQSNQQEVERYQKAQQTSEELSKINSFAELIDYADASAHTSTSANATPSLCVPTYAQAKKYTDVPVNCYPHTQAQANANTQTKAKAHANAHNTSRPTPGDMEARENYVSKLAPGGRLNKVRALLTNKRPKS